MEWMEWVGISLGWWWMIVRVGILLEWRSMVGMVGILMEWWLQFWEVLGFWVPQGQVGASQWVL